MIEIQDWRVVSMDSPGNSTPETCLKPWKTQFSSLKMAKNDLSDGIFF